MHATIDDVDAILDLAEEARDLSGIYKGMLTDRDIARKSLIAMIISPQCFVGFMGDGALIAIAGPSWFRSGYDIADIFFYARRGGLRLVREYIQWAKRFPGENMISLGITFGGSKGERTAQFYKRMGFELMGETFRVII